MARVWKIAPADNAKLWPMCERQGCIVLGWTQLKDYRKYKSPEQINEFLIKNGYDDRIGSARSVWRFTQEVGLGDVVIANADGGRAAAA